MNHIFKIKRKYPLVVVSCIVIAFIIIKTLSITINISPSMKEGIYINTYGILQRGDIVALCLTRHYQIYGLKRLYILKGRTCHGSEALVKKIIAIPGDHVILSGNTIVVNGVKYNFKTLYSDSLGRSLEVYPRGNYPDTAGYWMIGTHAPNSWDSRYWGPVSKNLILHKIQPSLVW